MKQNKVAVKKSIQSYSLLDRKKADPYKYVFTGAATSDKIELQMFNYNTDHCVEISDFQHDDFAVFENDDWNHWLNIHGLSQTDIIVAICQKQNIHSLVIQDILDMNQRPKFLAYAAYSFLTLKSLVPSENELLSEQISFVFGSNYLISFQERKGDYFNHIRHRLREKTGILRERTPDFLLYAMLESILDNYFKTINKLDAEIDQMNLIDLKRDLSPDILVDIEQYKKTVHYIKKSILPIKEFTQVAERGECQYIQQNNLKYFLEIKDLCLTLVDNCDLTLSSLESATNLFFSMQGHRMNQVMKTLTIVATIFIPLTFIAGIYGMNFTNMPELGWHYGYFGVVVLMFGVFVGMVYYFKKKGWF